MIQKKTVILYSKSRAVFDIWIMSEDHCLIKYRGIPQRKVNEFLQKISNGAIRIWLTQGYLLKRESCKTEQLFMF